MAGWLSGLKAHVDARFQSKWNTDLTITCRGQSFYVHRVILAAESLFFLKACDPDSPFKETRTGVIGLDDEDPFFVKLMLVYCYTGGITCEMFKEWNDYDCDVSRQEVVESSYQEGLCCVYIYALADKYQIRRLKSQAEECLRNHLEIAAGKCSGWEEVFFAKIVRKVYKTTPSTDRGLRDVLLEQTCKQFDSLIQYRRFKATMDKIDGFWGEFVQYKAGIDGRTRKCPGCKEDCYQSFSGWRGVQTFQKPPSHPCPNCCNAYTMEEWNMPKDTNYIDDDDDDDDDSTDGSDYEHDKEPAPSNKRNRDTDSTDLGTTTPPAKSLKANDDESAPANT